MRTINLCGRPNACCAEVHIGDDNMVCITDDNGGIVTMNKDEFVNLQKVKV